MLAFIFLILGSFLLILQTSLFTILPKWIGNPDLLFLVIIFMACRLDTYQGAILTLVFGLLMDIFSGIVPGLFPAVYLGLFATIKLLSKHFIIDEPSHQPPLAVAGYLLASGAIYLYTAFFSPDVTLFWSWRDLLLQMFILGILSVPSYHVFGSIQHLVASGGYKLWFSPRSRAGNRFIR
ncbi:MAG: rod shape-determining protein MreD [Proteobacteria bacterium]|nr:rod shape-determining protein MreD [Pseudomonadota bacterium]MBU1737606.1 rod shape-determining protein MreD [Pseudomonadota bacterium]